MVERYPTVFWQCGHVVRMNARTHTLPLYWLTRIFCPSVMLIAKSGEGRGTSAALATAAAFAIALAAARQTPVSVRSTPRFGIFPQFSARAPRGFRRLPGWSPRCPSTAPGSARHRRAFQAGHHVARQLHQEVPVIAGAGEHRAAFGFDRQMLPFLFQ